jgi:hypothetical protein
MPADREQVLTPVERALVRALVAAFLGQTDERDEQLHPPRDAAGGNAGPQTTGTAP